MFTASKPVPCVKCHATIATGEPITWHRGKNALPGVWHVACPSSCPPAVKFLDPMTDLVVPVEDHILPYVDDDLPPEPVEPHPGTRAWLQDASLSEREEQLAILLTDDTLQTQRQFTRAVVRYSRGLTDKETARLRRFARGLWIGLTLRIHPPVESDYLTGQLSLFGRASESAETPHSRETHAWRALVAEWATVPA